MKPLLSITITVFANICFQVQYINPMAPETVSMVESMAGLFEGSAEMSSDLYSLASVIYNSHPHNYFPVRGRAEDQPSTFGRYIFLFCVKCI